MIEFKERIIYNDSKSRKYRIFSNAIEKYFYNYKTLTISDIKALLSNDGFIYNPSYDDIKEYNYNISCYSMDNWDIDIYKEYESKDIEYNDAMIYDVIDNLFVRRGCLIRNDFINEEPTYTLLEQYYWDSTYTRSYYKLSDIDATDKQILLISDTHIGNKKLEDFNLLEKIYKYAINKGVKTCIHLGDLFDGNINNYDEFIKNINLFINNYPKTQIMTYCFLGNHDQIYQKYFNEKTILRRYDFRSLSLYRPDFYMFPRSMGIGNFGKEKFHLSHKLYYDLFAEDLKISQITDLEDVDKLKFPDLNLDFTFFRPEYKVNISGHLHQGFIKTTEDNYLYLGVPSASKLNQETSIATIITIHYNSKNEVELLEIFPLYRDSQNKITEGQRIIHNIHNPQNKKLSKTL